MCQFVCLCLRSLIYLLSFILADYSVEFVFLNLCGGEHYLASFLLSGLVAKSRPNPIELSKWAVCLLFVRRQGVIWCRQLV